MDIILVSNRWAKTRSIKLGGSQIVLAMFLIVSLMIVAVIVSQYALARLAPAGMSEQLRVLLGGMPLMKKALVEDRASLDTLAMKLGEMQVRMQRIDALGGRLVKLTGMKPSEFQFDQQPAQGGPLVAPGNLSALSLASQLDLLTQSVDDRADKLMALETLLMQNQLSRGLLPSTMPIVDGWYTSNFGWRVDPFSGKRAMHEGVDFMSPPGTAIHASAGGVVVYSDTHPEYGNMVEVDHGNDIVTRYAHASRLLVKVGQVVRRGDKIAEVGSTGRSTGNHLHFEVRYKGMAQNPERFLQNAAG